MKTGKPKNIILSYYLLLIFFIYLSARYSHPIIILHNLNHHSEKESGLHLPEKFDCSLFHDLYFEFNKNNDENISKIARIYHDLVINEERLIERSYFNTSKSRAPPVFI
jgi:hypothetical protein